MTDLAPNAVCSNHPDIIEGVRRCTRCARNFCADCLVLIGGQPYCGMCKGEQLLDVRSGIDATLPYASLGRRFAGMLLDALPWTAISMYMVFSSLITGTAVTFNWKLVAIGISFVLYDAVMTQMRGQTLGKMALKTRVVRIDGSPITAGQAWLRAISRYILNFFYVVDWITIFFTRERLCVHDMIARTRVIDTD